MSNEENQELKLPLANASNKSKPIKRALAVLFVFAVSIISTITIKNNLDNIAVPAYSDGQRPVRSMVFIRRTNNIRFVSCIPGADVQVEDTGDTGGEEINPCGMFDETLFQDQITAVMDLQFGYSITGSASVVGHDLSRDMSYVLTAYHVCRDFDQRYLAIRVPVPGPHTLIFRYEPSIVLTDFYGNEFRAEEIRDDADNDLCLLGSDELMSSIEPIRVAATPPVPGDRIFNIASPHGLSQPGAVLSYAGYHAGTIAATYTIKFPHYLNAIPTAPGSSGSPILNEAGEIISITSYGYIERPRGPIPPHDMWPNASAGPSLESIQQLVMPRIIQ